jgi:hypothetical protein
MRPVYGLSRTGRHFFCLAKAKPFALCAGRPLARTIASKPLRSTLLRRRGFLPLCFSHSCVRKKTDTTRSSQVTFAEQFLTQLLFV